ncbi:S-methyl-5'-thioadenosine phosphorylase [Tsukamurella sp. 8F]|uniref:S-methyl-5'-thioadenosine phosphorylase n=1 Tax=unclassified Tsukamurella TaxID=2633480 RepID=UPI0023BA2792|nr:MULTISPECIES: S-methyl-5'-thioadenosine phosphorylase [unclassified Tsukamurella]MDF0529841.1 S-methyl-5'-thioadenosine phosphorylase [Tsukamurella sp. 8J]MDF0587033.1 S-methyl-5'-thioadenosine phosphorylase [Tsukamurella sp. 8F]
MTSNEPHIAVVGGTGLYRFFDGPTDERVVDTPYGPPSAPVSIGTVGETAVAFLPRHGRSHEFAPHTVPYRANMWALHSLGVRKVLAPCAVGSLTTELPPGSIAVPDQLVDRTTSRVSTYFDGPAIHVGFADPYCPGLRRAALGTGAAEGGTMTVIEGPRFSSRAESRWYAAQGWSLLNMTGLPEAALARELKLCYAAIALVTDFDAGIEPGEGVQMADVLAEFGRHVDRLTAAVRTAVSATDPEDGCLCAAGEQPRPA